MMLFQKFICTACGHEWELPPSLGRRQDICPACGREKVRRIDAGIRRQGFPLADKQGNAMGRA